MPKKQDIKAVGLVVVGVMIAGFAMHQFRDIDLIAQSRHGFN